MTIKIKNTAFVWGVLGLLCGVSGGWSMDPGPNEEDSLSLSRRQADNASSAPRDAQYPPPTPMKDLMSLLRTYEFLDKHESFFEIGGCGDVWMIFIEDLESVRQGLVPIIHSGEFLIDVNMVFDIDNMDIDEFFEGFLQACIDGQLIPEGVTINDVRCEMRYYGLGENAPQLSSRVLTGLQFESYLLTQSFSIQNLTNLKAILLKDTFVHRFPFKRSQRLEQGEIAIEVNGGDNYALMPLVPKWIRTDGINDQMIPICENGGAFFNGWNAMGHLVHPEHLDNTTFRLPLSVENSRVAFNPFVKKSKVTACSDGQNEEKKESDETVPMLPAEMCWNVMSFVSPVDCLYLKSSFLTRVQLEHDIHLGRFGFKGSCLATEYLLEEHIGDIRCSDQSSCVPHQELINHADKFDEPMTFVLNFYDDSGHLYSDNCHVTERFHVAKQDHDQYAWTGVWDVTEEGTERHFQLTFGPIETRDVLADDRPYTQFPGLRHFQLCLHTLCLDLLTANLEHGTVRLAGDLQSASEDADTDAGPAGSSDLGSASSSVSLGHPKDKAPGHEDCEELD